MLIDEKQVYAQAAGDGPLGPAGLTPVRATVRLYHLGAAWNPESYRAPMLPAAKGEDRARSTRKAMLGMPLGPFVCLGGGSIPGMDETKAQVTRDG